MQFLASSFACLILKLYDIKSKIFVLKLFSCQNYVVFEISEIKLLKTFSLSITDRPKKGFNIFNYSERVENLIRPKLRHN